MVGSLLLLDVDGPLSPFRASWFGSRSPAAGFGFHDLTPDGGVTYRVALNPNHGEQILRLAEGGFELVWATTWLEDANRLIAPLLGIPDDLPVIPLQRPTSPTGTRCWKASQIADWVGSQPFVWFDDEINRATRTWLDAAGLATHLAHRVEPHLGLVDEDFETAQRFLRRH